MTSLIFFPFVYFFGHTMTIEEPPSSIPVQEEAMIETVKNDRVEVLPVEALEDNVLEIYHGRECPHCQAELEWIENSFSIRYPEIRIETYEVWHDEKNQERMNTRFQSLGLSAPTGVPANVFEGEAVVGFDAKKIEAMVEEAEQTLETPLVDKYNENNPTVLIHTTEGDIILEIYEEEVPTIAANFLTLAEEGKYDGTIFHRVIPGFMIQGGDYENFNGTGGQAAQGGKIEDEINENFKHLPGTLSMANSGPNTNGSQFFIMDGAAPWLDGAHSIFGNVLGGQDTVSSIVSARTLSGDKPTEDIAILSIEIIRD